MIRLHWTEYVAAALFLAAVASLLHDLIHYHRGLV